MDTEMATQEPLLLFFTIKEEAPISWLQSCLPLDKISLTCKYDLVSN